MTLETAASLSHSQWEKYLFNPIATECRLLITFANSLESDQARQDVGPDLGPNWFTVFLKEISFRKS